MRQKVHLVVEDLACHFVQPLFELGLVALVQIRTGKIRWVLLQVFCCLDKPGYWIRWYLLPAMCLDYIVSHLDQDIIEDLEL